MKQRLKTRAAIASIASNSVLIAMKLSVGVLMPSVSVISEAVHSGLDLVAAIIAFISVSFLAKPADRKHNFGHGKIENITATIEAVLISAAAIYIIYEAVQKLERGNSGVEGLGIGTIVMGISAGGKLYNITIHV